MSQAGERTEKATSRRRQRAKDDGQFAYSQEFTGALTLAAGLVAAYYFLQTPEGFRTFFVSVLQEIATSDTPELILVSIIRQAGMYFLVAAAPVFVAAVAAALVGNFLQGMPAYAGDALGLKWEKLNPMQGLSKLKGQISGIQWLKMILMIGITAFVVWKTLIADWDKLVALPAYSIEASSAILRSITIRILAYVATAVVVLAIGDFFYQRWKFEKSIKQTKAEVKEDMKALEGNPAVKGKIKSIQRAAARRRMMSRVKDATVIVTNPTHYAVALEYKPDQMGAPRVIAKGVDFLAQRIKQEGRDHDIPLVENVPLARALYRSVAVDQEIPMDLYKAVAEVLAYVFKIRNGSR